MRSSVVAACFLGTLAAAAAAQGDADAEHERQHHEAATQPVSHKGADDMKLKPSGLLGKPIEVPGIGVQLKFGGFVKLDVIQDFDPVGNTKQFKVNSIPVKGDDDYNDGGNTEVQARQTRLSVDARRDTPMGGVRAYVETDFFGGDDLGLRLRHGYGEWRGLLAGQTWTTFQDISARPFTLDYEGPDAEIFVRQALLRYTGNLWRSLQGSIAIEDPDSEVSVPDGVSGSGRSEVPDFAGNLRFEQQWGHVQLGGLLRQIRFVYDGGGDETTWAGGFNLSGRFKLTTNDEIMGHVAYGAGLGRYIESFGGVDSDAALSADGDLDPLPSLGTVLGFSHHWNKQFSSSISGAYAHIDNDSSQGDGAINSAISAHVNTVYRPLPFLMLGAELMWGRRENNGGADGDALRLQISVQVDLA